MGGVAGITPAGGSTGFSMISERASADGMVPGGRDGGLGILPESHCTRDSGWTVPAGTGRPRVRRASDSRSDSGASSPCAASRSVSRKTSSGVPSAATAPSTTIAIRSIRTASSGDCVMKTTLSRYSSTIDRSRPRMSSRSPGSSDEVGSSQMRYRGRIETTEAIATRCFSPPDSLWGGYWRYFSRWNRSSAHETRRWISLDGRPRFSSPKATSRSTVVETSWLSGFWKIIPVRWWTCHVFDGSAVFRPSTRTRPDWGTINPFKQRARVLFPEPLGPITATLSDSPISNDRPRSVGTAFPGWTR